MDKLKMQSVNKVEEHDKIVALRPCAARNAIPYKKAKGLKK